ncbi:Beta-1,3-galactosyltransferase 2 [Bulinus truncatus]|nr:Beta-1,3-galactosyltransferase 2 [Bulinus truncatus]
MLNKPFYRKLIVGVVVLTLIVYVALYTKYDAISRTYSSTFSAPIISRIFSNSTTPFNQTLHVNVSYAQLASTTLSKATATPPTITTPTAMKRKPISPNVTCLNRDVTLVIGVPSSRDHFEARKTVRKTWGAISKDPSAHVILLFFIGFETLLHSPIQQMVESEAKEFGDIMQDDYIDTYRNLSLKTLSILKWVAEQCPKSQFVLKADDDMYINVPVLIDHLKKHAQSNGPNATFVLGQASRNGEPIRDKNSKWYASFKEYNETRYPTFAFGPSYSMTTSAAGLLYEASKALPYFYLEDVYVTGLCARKAGVPVLHSGLFSNYRLPVSGCAFQNHISGHAFQPVEIAKIDAEMRDKNIKCG